VFDPYAHLAQLGVESLLAVSQLFPVRFLKGGLKVQARHLPCPPCVRLNHRDLGDLIAESLIAFVGIGFAPIRQAVHGLQCIAQLLIVHPARYRVADSENMIPTIGHKLGLEREAFFYPNSAPSGRGYRSAARRAAPWRQ